MKAEQIRDVLDWPGSASVGTTERGTRSWDIDTAVTVLTSLLSEVTEGDELEQFQIITVTRLADRHATLHGRDFAESHEVVVRAGTLSEVLAQVDLPLPVARYSLTISEPFDGATS